MSNAPEINLSPEAIALLRKISDHEWRGRGLRCGKCPERDALKRKGLIFSRPPNANPIQRAVGGHGYQWQTTPSGRALLEYLDA